MKLAYQIIIFIVIILASCKNDTTVSHSTVTKEDVKQSSVQKVDRKIVTTATSKSDNIIVKKEDEQVNVKERVFEAKKEGGPDKKNKYSKDTAIKQKSKNTLVKKPKPKEIEKGNLSFFSNSYDFGFIEMGEVVDHTFRFKNTGKKAVNISNATATCGCTTPIFPFIPIESGEEGKIDVRFNSKGRLGPQSATITVYSDAEKSEMQLELTGTVRAEIASPSEFIDTTNQ